MHRSTWHHWLGATVLTVGLSVLYAPNTLISLAVAQSTTVWEEAPEFVRIVPQDGASPPANDQPVEISPQELAAMLESLRVEPAKVEEGEEPLRVFTQREREVLGDAFAEALSIAGPRQDVEFMSVDSRSMGSGGFARKVLVNKGRVFYQNGELNVIFGELRAPYRQKNVYGQMEPWPYSPGSRTSPSKFRKWRLVVAAGVALRTDSEGERKDWVVIEPAVAVAAAESVPQAVGAPVAATAVVAQATTSPPTPTAQSQTAEERLVFLGDFWEKSLITEDVYLAKMNEILDTDPVTSSQDVEERLTALQALRQKDLITEEVYLSRTEVVLPPASQGIEQRLTVLKDLRDKGLISEEVYRANVEEVLESL